MTNASGFAPVDVKVLVKPDPVEERIGSIILADATKEKNKYAAMRGTLLATGPNAFAEWGQGNAPLAGARVVHAQYAGLRIKGDDGEDYLLMNDEDVVGLVAA